EQPVAPARGLQQARVDERGERVDRSPPEHGLERLEVEAADERREPEEHLALAWREELVAPVDGRAHRPMALGRIARAAGQLEPGREPCEQIVGSERPEQRRGALDRERGALELRADRRDRLARPVYRRGGDAGGAGVT